jgi:deazaflavin-dependent oxidoreductase (nitroreductase family)
MDAYSDKFGFYTRLAQRLGHYRWFALMMKHVGCKMDRALFRASGGRLWLSGPALPTMLLTTTGRKTGKERTVPVYYVRDGQNLVAACEDFGLEKASNWPKNILADPHVKVQIGKSLKEYWVRLATDEETTRNMPRLVDMWPAHNTYQERSGRRFVFVFQPSRPSFD